jgi:hypothetical protein
MQQVLENALTKDYVSVAQSLQMAHAVNLLETCRASYDQQIMDLVLAAAALARERGRELSKLHAKLLAFPELAKSPYFAQVEAADHTSFTRFADTISQWEHDRPARHAPSPRGSALFGTLLSSYLFQILFSEVLHVVCARQKFKYRRIMRPTFRPRPIQLFARRLRIQQNKRQLLIPWLLQLRIFAMIK